MKKLLLTLSIISAIVITALVACQDNGAATQEIAAVVNKDSLVNRGAYLVTTMMCDDCHSPKRMGAHGPEIIPELRLSGFRHDDKLPSIDTNEIKKGWTLFNHDLTSAVGEWGASFSANLTSDETGIGTWTEQQFFKAIREGKLKGMDQSRPLLPPMPWQNVKQLNDNDLRAVFTYLKSTKPVDNIVPRAIPLSELK
jgi:hypothetical protein